MVIRMMATTMPQLAASVAFVWRVKSIFNSII
jgi:hypothetical protein